MIYRGGNTLSVTLYRAALREGKKSVRQFPDSSQSPAAMNEHRQLVGVSSKGPPAVDPKAFLLLSVSISDKKYPTHCH